MEMLLKRLVSVFLLCILCTGCFGCTPDKEYVTETTVIAMDTYVYIRLTGDKAEAEDLRMRIIREVDRIDKTFSAYNEESEIWRINHRQEAKVSISRELYNILYLADSMAAHTKGAFDYTLGTLTMLWGEERLPTPEEVNEAKEACGYEKVNLILDGTEHYIEFSNDKTQIDLGGVIKGYAADRIYGILSSDPDTKLRGIVSLGGNVVVKGHKNGDKSARWQIGVRDPLGETEDDIIDIIEVDDGTVTSTSGGYRRYFTWEGKIYHHIIDRSTGYPAGSDLSSVTVYGPSGIMSDILSTACFVMGSEQAGQLLAEVGYDGYFVDEEGNGWDFYYEENIGR